MARIIRARDLKEKITARVENIYKQSFLLSSSGDTFRIQKPRNSRKVELKIGDEIVLSTELTTQKIFKIKKVNK